MYVLNEWTRVTLEGEIGASRKYRASTMRPCAMLTPIAIGKLPSRAVTTNAAATTVLKAMDTNADVIRCYWLLAYHYLLAIIAASFSRAIPTKYLYKCCDHYKNVMD